jgi:hypothetical protein
MKMAVFWVVAPCSLVEVCRCSKGTCSLHHQADEKAAREESVLIPQFLASGLLNALITEAANTSETSVNSYQTTRRSNLADIHLHTRRREDLEPHSRSIILFPRTSFAFFYVQLQGNTGAHSGKTEQCQIL